MSTLATDTAQRWLISPQRAYQRALLYSRLIGPRLVLGHAGWLVPLAVMLFAGVLRFWNLDNPHLLTFDETYYVKDAYTMLHSGTEQRWGDDPNPGFLAGNPAPLDDPSYVVHPPLGKWMIALGMVVFGTDTGLGWRAGPAFFGTLSVLFIALIAQKLFSSVLLGGIAGLLTAVDGHHLVLSRTGLLDIFMMFFIVVAFWALLNDRFHGRAKLADALADAHAAGYGARALRYGPWLLWRPWRLVAGVALGGALGVKWSALSFIAVFGLLTVLWDLGARRRAGIEHWVLGGLLREGIPAFLTIIPATAITYLFTWTGWFVTYGGYNRHWAGTHPGGSLDWIPGPLRSLADYHRSAYAFHQSLSSDHSWESSPWSWLFAGRPTLFHYKGTSAGEDGCTIASCVRAITDLPNPVFWWAATLSLLVVLLFWIGARDWRAGAILSGLLAGFVPWFAYPDRTMFFFYTIAFEPFMVLAVCFVIGKCLPRTGQAPWHRRRNLIGVSFFLVLVMATSAFFWPVWTGEMISYDAWRLRIWMPSWS